MRGEGIAAEEMRGEGRGGEGKKVEGTRGAREGGHVRFLICVQIYPSYIYSRSVRFTKLSNS